MLRGAEYQIPGSQASYPKNPRHQMSTSSTNTEFVLNCTCCPTGALFIGSKEDCIRNMVQHQKDTMGR